LYYLPEETEERMEPFRLSVARYMGTFKSAAALWVLIIGDLLLSIIAIRNRGDCTRCRKECLRLNVVTAARLPWCLLSLRRASQFIAETVSRNTGLTGRRESVWASG
jgi:hypothetical protein